ncbi:MAG: SH3 domain-containing protein [Leptotrichiaceae bacterium]|nr:SH3 domain-containing protein [Leptotrichiaceae bacterium]
MKILKKLLLSIIFLGIFSLGTANEKFEVNSADEITNLREKASKTSKILAELEKEESGDVIKKEGNWYYVKYKTKTGKNIYGYIHKSQIMVGEIYIASSKDGYVNVRNQEDLSSQILESLPNGTKIMKYSQKGDWCYVKFSVKDGGALSEDYGYIHKSQLKKLK